MNTSLTTLAENILGLPVEWTDSHTGYLSCPGSHLHSKKDGKRHCRVILDGVPTVSCFHQSCGYIITALNQSLRSELAKAAKRGNPFGQPRVAMLADQKRKQEAELRRLESENRRQAAFIERGRILSDFATTVPELSASSPDALPENLADHWKPFLKLFRDTDTVWIGEKEDSISRERLATIEADHGRVAAAFQIERYRKHFRTVAEWPNHLQSHPLDQFTCPAVFNPGCFSRSNSEILKRPYLVVESDELTKAEVCAVFNWLRETLRLRAVVDTAGKSLHGWFEMPSPESLERLKDTLPALGCDPKMFTPSQPCRMPGAIRSGKETPEGKAAYQKLIYIDTKGNAV